MIVQEKKPIPTILSQSSESTDRLTISDLNRYLPALRSIKDIRLTADNMEEGLYWCDGLAGLKNTPDNSIDLIITDPPSIPKSGNETDTRYLTLQQYFEWNKSWLYEAHRVLKSTGSIYLFSSWKQSGMYQSMLNLHFQVRSRITWRKPGNKSKTKSNWIDRAGDIWFATKSDQYHYKDNTENHEEPWTARHTNLWSDILDIRSMGPTMLKGDIPDIVLQRILETSSYKLGWVLDPFMRYGGIGVAVRKWGRRFIGFEIEKDPVLMAMKRIDQI